MSSGLDKLMLQVGLIDKVTKPLKGIKGSVEKLGESTKAGFQKMAGGALSIAGAGLAVQSALMPAIEMDRRMGELSSLGTTETAMAKLKKTALGFAVEYGKSATEFVEASYDIQSAIGGLKGDELANFTKASAVLAAATKSDTKTITSYMGTMYGIFQNQANEIGKSTWVNRVAGMTAQAVKMFKMDGDKMSQAFERLGSSATAMGASMQEQMGVLGMLGASMGGSEAATKYQNFIAGATKAQKALGLSFSDSRGKLLPTVKILDLLKRKFGDLSHMGTKDFTTLQKAFGNKQAVEFIQALADKTQELSANINTLGQVKGMDIATKMAKKQTDQWERLENAWFAIRAAAGGLIMPAFARIAGMMANGATLLMAYMDKYPELTALLGYAAMAVVGFGVACGVASFMTGALGVAMAVLTSPITLTVAAIAALVAVVIWGWDYIKAFFDGFYQGFMKTSGLTAVIAPIKGIFITIGEAISFVVKKLMEWFPVLNSAKGDMAEIIQLGGNVGETIGKIFNVITAPATFALSMIDKLLKKIKALTTIKMPSLNMPSFKMPSFSWPFSGDDDSETKRTASQYLKQKTSVTAVPSGGLSQAMASQGNQGGNVTHTGDITVIQQKPHMTIAEITEQAELQHG
ncbi:phage tail tape measure protein [Photobacterium sp. S4TG1]|uniref:phage tail tape measure protein n=1 Tax=Photobacterium sp. S4TG1 TaxID=3114587 RepID=UPI002E181594|nr:phage tail tape measure protein [Photobacterium sp. S4TG1]